MKKRSRGIVIAKTTTTTDCPTCGKPTTARVSSSQWDTTTSHNCTKCRMRTLAYSTKPDNFAWYKVPANMR